MSNQSLFTDQFLTSIREAYQSSKPVLDGLLPEIAAVQKFFTALRIMVELQPEIPGYDKSMFLSYLTRLDGALTLSASVMTALHGLAQSVNGVVSEHEEKANS